MKIYKVSVPELWHRIYYIEADSFEDAVRKYKENPYEFHTLFSPEYLGPLLDTELPFVEAGALDE